MGLPHWVQKRAPDGLTAEQAGQALEVSWFQEELKQWGQGSPFFGGNGIRQLGQILGASKI